MRVSDQTAAALRQAQALIARDEALSEVATLLDPTGNRSAWAVAGDIQSARLRLARALPRIVAGARDPSPLEAALMVAEQAGLPESRRRVWDLITELLD